MSAFGTLTIHLHIKLTTKYGKRGPKCIIVEKFHNLTETQAIAEFNQFKALNPKLVGQLMAKFTLPAITL